MGHMRIVLLGSLLLLTGMAFAQGIFRNQRIFVVPRPGPVTIDGDLKDWDLSGEILSYISDATMDFENMRTAMMYDADALYLSCRVADTSPMMSRWDPAVNPDFGWDADAFQLRLSLNPALGYPPKIGSFDRSPSDELVHMTLWYFTDDKKPVLHMKYGMDFHDAPDYPKGIVPAAKFQGAYRKWDDGKGYTLEYRLPWSTLRAKQPPKAGDLLAGALQVQWGNPEGTHDSGTSVDLQRTVGFSYMSTACWGKLLFTDHGNLPKELTQEGVPPVRKLPVKFNYTLPKESIVSVALVNPKGDRVRHIMAAEKRPQGALTEAWDGLDDEGNIIPAGTYKWIGAYHDPFSVRHVLSVANSGTPSYHTPDGKGAWGGDWGNPMDVCFAGDKALLAWSSNEAGNGIIMLDKDANKQWGEPYGASYLATDGEWFFAYLPDMKQVRAYAVADGRQTNFLRGELWAEHNAGKETICNGLAWSAGKLYIANTTGNTINEYDARKGTMLRTLNVPAPGWLAVVKPGMLAVISGGQVQQLSLADGKVTPWLATNLDEPQAVTVGPDGTAYVSNAGELQNISVFTADGKYLRSIGKRGGRALPKALRCLDGHAPSIEQRGKWQPDTLLNPRGMALSPTGQLWVMEDDFQPKRVSVWNAKDGQLIAEKFGACYVNTPVTMDPADPTRVYCQNVEWLVDLDKGTWKANAVMIDKRPDSPWFWPHSICNIVFTAKNGKQYMSGASGWAGVAKGGQGVFLYIRRGDHFEGAAGVIWPDMPLSWRKGLPADDPRVTGSLFWIDVNGDGVIQEKETKATRLSPRTFSCSVDADLNFYVNGGFDHLYWERLSPTEILPNGVPLYDEATLKHVNYADASPLYTHDIGVNPADGSVLMYAGARWEAMSRLKIWPITYWTKDGALQWRYYKGCEWPDTYSMPVPKAGDLYGCTKCIGITDGITGFSNYFGSLQLMTTDGVMLGMIMKDGRVDVTGPDRINCEWFTGQLIKLKDGRWLLLAGDQDGRVLEVQGLNSVKRFEGTLTITDADVKAATDALAEYSTQKARAQSLVIAHSLEAPDWVNIHGLTLTQDERRQFTVKTAYDATNLYLNYEVTSPNELTNSAQDIQLLFKGGNAIDLQLATDPNADPKRTAAAPGDLRVLITRRQGKATAVVYRPRVAGFNGEATVFTSPTGKETIDQITVWEDIQLTYEKTATGFNAVVALPLARLGWKPIPGTTVKMDVGYIFGNETGTVTSLRKYWNNRSLTSGVINDIPNESRLEPAQWGAATVE